MPPMKGDRIALSASCSQETNFHLTAMAKRNGRSLAEEIEFLLEQGIREKAIQYRLEDLVTPLIEAAIERAFARRDAPIEPLGSPPPAYAQ